MDRIEDLGVLFVVPAQGGYSVPCMHENCPTVGVDPKSATAQELVTALQAAGWRNVNDRPWCPKCVEWIKRIKRHPTAVMHINRIE